METPRTSPKDQRPNGPWMLKMTGHWGTGAHSALDVQEVHVLNLGLPPAEDQPVDGTFVAGGQAFVPEIVEDVEPEPGLDVRLGEQWLVQHDDRMEIVYDPDRS